MSSVETITTTPATPLGHLWDLRLAWVMILGTVVATGCAGPGGVASPSSEEPGAAPEPTFRLENVDQRQLDGWQAAGMAVSLAAFQRSCEAIVGRSAGARMVPDRPAYGTVGDWEAACQQAFALADTTDAAAERFFRRFFRPHRVAMGAKSEGLFTGYFEPQLRGSRQRTDTFSVPLHRPPSDLIRVRLGDFRSSMADQTLFGRVEGQQLVPYYSRADIADGVLAGRNLEIVWVDDRVDKFFLQIQGSGRVVLRDSSLIRVGYAAQNGQPYRAIGRDLITMGAVPREEMSMQAIRTWLAENPERAADLMNRNPSYIFFQERPNLDASEGPVGAQGVPLTARRSLAVDPDFLPYGAPLWLSTHRPVTGSDVATDTTDGVPTVPFRQLMIAQDTGGAIRGAVRGDVFWGAGDRARSIAGRMKSPGTYVVLLPNTIDPYARDPSLRPTP